MLNLIVAVDRQFGFSRQGVIPWKNKEDLHHFATVTSTCQSGLQNVVIMGRKTYESLPITHRPLPNRVNIVVSTTLDPITRGIHVTSTIEAAVTLALTMYYRDKTVDRIFLIGGLSLYTYGLQSMLLNRVYVTFIDQDCNCDQFFPVDLLYEKTYTEPKTTLLIDNVYVQQFITRQQYTGEQQYLRLLSTILNTGHRRPTRNSATLSTFGQTMSFDLQAGFPLLTTKRVPLRLVFLELKMILLGITDSGWLSKQGVKIWDANTTREFLDKGGLGHYQVGDMGPTYGFQLRNFNTPYQGKDHDYFQDKQEPRRIDQLAEVIQLLTKDRYSRRILMTTYNPAQAKEGVLYPCHGLVVNFGVEGESRLCCHMHQRSADYFLGFPFNIASYALLVHIICELVNNSPDLIGPKFIPGKLSFSLGDTHLYDQPDHWEAALTQLARLPRQFPTVRINKKLETLDSLQSLEYTDLVVEGYQPHPTLKAKMVA